VSSRCWWRGPPTLLCYPATFRLRLAVRLLPCRHPHADDWLRWAASIEFSSFCFRLSTGGWFLLVLERCPVVSLCSPRCALLREQRDKSNCTLRDRVGYCNSDREHVGRATTQQDSASSKSRTSTRRITEVPFPSLPPQRASVLVVNPTRCTSRAAHHVGRTGATDDFASRLAPCSNTLCGVIPTAAPRLGVTAYDQCHPTTRAICTVLLLSPPHDLCGPLLSALVEAPTSPALRLIVCDALLCHVPPLPSSPLHLTGSHTSTPRPATAPLPPCGRFAARLEPPLASGRPYRQTRRVGGRQSMRRATRETGG